MKEMFISKFKTICLAILEWMKKAGKSVGQSAGGLGSAPAGDQLQRKLGSMRGTARIVGDIVSPASDEDDWEVLRS